MSDLRALAEQYVRLSSEIEGVRQAMLAALTNGAGENRPFISPSGETGGSQARRDAAAEEEAKILALIRERPMRTSEIARAMAAAGSTTIQRLRRLRERGQITGGGEDGWRVA